MFLSKVTGDTTFVVGSKGRAEVKNLVKGESVKQTTEIEGSKSFIKIIYRNDGVKSYFKKMKALLNDVHIKF